MGLKDKRFKSAPYKLPKPKQRKQEIEEEDAEFDPRFSVLEGQTVKKWDWKTHKHSDEENSEPELEEEEEATPFESAEQPDEEDEEEEEAASSDTDTSGSSEADPYDYDADPGAFSEEDDDGEEVMPTKRMAIINCDWSHLTAEDLYMAMHSQLPTSLVGKLRKVEIFRSEYGKKMLEYEEENGPDLWGAKGEEEQAEENAEGENVLELIEDSNSNHSSDVEGQDKEEEEEDNTPTYEEVYGKELNELDEMSVAELKAAWDKLREEQNLPKISKAEEDAELRELDKLNEDCDDERLGLEDSQKFSESKFRRYEMQRLKYYYGIATFSDCVASAHIYKELQDVEILSSGVHFHFQFVDDDEPFDDEPTDVCTHPNPTYKINNFSNSASTDGKFEVTWDRVSMKRKQDLRKFFDDNFLMNPDTADLAAYLESNSDDDDNDTDNDSAVQRKRALLLSGLENDITDDHTDDDDVEDLDDIMNPDKKAQKKQKKKPPLEDDEQNDDDNAHFADAECNGGTYTTDDEDGENGFTDTFDLADDGDDSIGHEELEEDDNTSEHHPMNNGEAEITFTDPTEIEQKVQHTMKTKGLSVHGKRQHQLKEKRKKGKKEKLKAIREQNAKIDSVEETEKRAQALSKVLEDATNLKELDVLTSSTAAMGKKDKRKLHKKQVVAKNAQIRAERKKNKEQALLLAAGLDESLISQISLSRNKGRRPSQTPEAPEIVGTGSLKKDDITDKDVNVLADDERFKEMFDDPEMAMEQHHPKWKKSMVKLQRKQAAVRTVRVKKRQRAVEESVMSARHDNPLNTTSPHPNGNNTTTPTSNNHTTSTISEDTVSKLNSLSQKKIGAKRKWRSQRQQQPAKQQRL